MRVRISLAIWAALAVGPAAAVEPPPECAGDPQPDRLSAVTPEGDLLLGSERLARLSGVRLPDDPDHRQEAVDRLRSRLGQSLLVSVQGSQDRWGRLPIRARLTGAPPLRDRTEGVAQELAQDLVEAGLAMVDPGADSTLCQPDLLAMEETAREGHLGLWADGRYNPIPVDQADRLTERVGRFVIVEGRVRSIGERKQRTYLNFGGHWAEDFTIIIPKKTWLLMARRGLSADQLKGHVIRARGILQSWQGTALAVDSPEMIERLEGGSREDRRLAR